MKVLMFGWEFPPMITGGLGTACQGLSAELSHLIEKITFILPQRVGPGKHPETPHLELVDASELLHREHLNPIKPSMPSNISTELVDSKIQNSLEFISVSSILTPYLSEKEYQQQLKIIQEQTLATGTSKSTASRDSSSQNSVQTFMSGGYGAHLFSEVSRFSQLATQAVLLDQYDIIHAHDWMTFPAGVAAKRMSRRPLVLHVHSLEFDRCGDNINQAVYDIERYGLENADRIIAVSHRTKEMIVSRYGISPHLIHVIHNGVTPVEKKVFGHKPFNGPLVSFMGRITMQKGPEYFLNAAYLVSQKIPNVQFVMAGHGDLRNRMVLRMAELQLVDRFHFPGFLNESHRAELLSMTDVFVLSSVSEPFGLTPMEALQFGVPVIVSKQSGVSEVLQHAIKVDFWDARKMADAIIKILSEPSLALNLGQGGMRELNTFTWQRPAHQIHQLYKEIL
ncbi:MAG TPA: glycosyltransferase [Pseudobdellovibrionaceae bacterium]|nr:glycosyltransferase [Pseudobdellovibrionaceae bacterium]